jgi:hypothetical protein
MATRKDRQKQGIKNRFLPHSGGVVLKTYSIAVQIDSFLAMDMRQADLCQPGYDVSGRGRTKKKATP